MSVRIVVDARELAGHPTGVGRYLRELLVRWGQAPYAAGAECLLLGPQPPPDRDALCAAAGPGARLRWQDVPGAGGTWWEQGALARAVNRSGADVLFAPAYSMPLAARVPTVLAMHDVSFAAHPEWFSLREGLRRRVLAHLAAQKAAAIVTLTRFSARDIVARLGVRSARLHVIPLAVDYLQTALDAPLPAADADGETDARRPTGVLFVGSIFERRNIPMLMAGVARAGETVPGFTLTLVGDNRTRPRLDLEAAARAAGLGDALRVQGYVDDATLAGAYQRNGLFAFLSSYEGFGLPPLEAMRAGLPTVVLDTPVAREVYGEGAVYVRAGDVNGLAATLVRLATDAGARSTLAARGRRVADGYRWAETAERTWQVLTLSASSR